MCTIYTCICIYVYVCITVCYIVYMYKNILYIYIKITFSPSTAMFSFLLLMCYNDFYTIISPYDKNKPLEVRNVILHILSLAS